MILRLIYLHTGISLYDQKGEFEKGNFYYEKTPAKEIIEKLTGTNTKMLVGIPPKKKYSKQSYGLGHVDYYKKAEEILNIGYEYGIECIPSDNLHFKFYRIDDIYITGGINFGNSMWNDCSVLIENKEDKEKLQYLFDCLWRGEPKYILLSNSVLCNLMNRSFQQEV